MEVINLNRARRFLRARPLCIGLFDRPQLVADLLCLEPDQEEARPLQRAADELYLVLEGRAKLRVGVQTAELETMDAVVVPPGLLRTIQNPGPGRLTALALLAPKPTRALEAGGRPRRTGREPGPASEGRRRAAPGREGPPPRGRGAPPRAKERGREGRSGQKPSAAPRSGRPGVRRGQSGRRGPGRSGPRPSAPR